MSGAIVAAPFSLTGSAQRIWRKFNGIWKVLAILLIAIAWTFVLSWYCIFGILLVPYRLVRRGQRKQTIAAQRHEEMLQAVRPAAYGFAPPTVTQ